jgi:hypothetical protein
MMGGRRHKKRRGGQPPEDKNVIPSAPPKEQVQASNPELFMNPLQRAVYASRTRKAKEEKNQSGQARRRKTRKFRGGNGYGFTATPGDVINAGNIAWTPNMTSVPDGKPVVGSVTGGRRRKSKKGKRASRKRTMRGGGSVANVGYGFAGTGARGIADAIPYASNLPPAGEFAIPTGTR